MGKGLSFYTLMGLLFTGFVVKLGLKEFQGSLLEKEKGDVFGGDISEGGNGAYCNSPLMVHVNSGVNEINASVKHHIDYQARLWENSDLRVSDDIDIIKRTFKFLCSSAPETVMVSARQFLRLRPSSSQCLRNSLLLVWWLR
ncbi:hypothetical protein GIB67_014402 [Kingdonia uniflora]|uniref:Uncharacterized protein n=1 Tax=Kingdonia uniflora TaxID=39325 RepID=A0A7J7LZ10_9MAGN|nr:hypothetical protein GIB67_014402 [Kingdonia uniflora]